MFDKLLKKKQAAPAQEDYPPESQAPAYQPGQSLFAQEINPQPANIDFFGTAIYSAPYEPPPVPPPLPEDMPGGMPPMAEAPFPPPGEPAPMDPMAYAGPPELAPFPEPAPLPPPAEQLPWEEPAGTMPPPPSGEPAPWEPPADMAPPFSPQAEPASWDNPAPSAWEAPANEPAPMAWEQPGPVEPAGPMPWEPTAADSGTDMSWNNAPAESGMPWDAPAAGPAETDSPWEASPLEAASPAQSWEQPDPANLPPPVDVTPAPQVVEAWNPPPPETAWEPPSTQEPEQVSALYPEDALPADADWSPQMETALPPQVAGLYPSDEDFGGPVGEAASMPDYSAPPPEVADPFATSFDEPESAVPPLGSYSTEESPSEAFGALEADPMGGFGTPPGDDLMAGFGAPAGDDLMNGFEAPSLEPGFAAPDPMALDAGVSAFEESPAPPEPMSTAAHAMEPAAPDLANSLFSGPAEAAEDPFATEAGSEDDFFSPTLPGEGAVSGPAFDLADDFDLSSVPSRGDFEPPHVDEVESGRPALDLWDNLESERPVAGQQVPDSPEATGQFLDSVTEQLYPDDPFGIDSSSLSDSAQAFEEASQYLFPETTTAPVEWEEDPVSHDPLEALPGAPASPMDLGPSFQAESEQISDLTDSYAPPPELTPAPPAESLPEWSTEMPSSLTDFPSSPQAASSDPWASAPASDGDPWASAPAPEIDPWGSAPASDGDPWTPAPAVADDVWSIPIEPAPDAAAYEPPPALHPYAEPEESVIDSYSHPYAEPETASAHPYAEPEPTEPEAASIHPYAEPESAPADLSDAFGEEAEAAVPVYELDNVIPLQAHPPEPEAEEASAWDILAPAPEPSLEPAPVAPTAQPEPTPVASSGNGHGLAMDNLQILGFCPLEGNQRLLMVESNGTFALMGQGGDPHNPSITKIKEFNYNPLQYQNTFTAVKESAAENQGLYIAQVGTWRGIISTVKDNVMLHTELG